MFKYSDNNPVKLRVENFGPIKEAEIDLCPLTVFIGPTNTGKSYLSKLIYALHCCFGVFNRQDRFNRLVEYYSNGSKFLNNSTKNYRKSAVEALINSVQQNFKEANSETHFELTLPTEIAEDVRLTINSTLATSFHTELCRCFGLNESDELIRKQSKSGLVRISRQVTSDLKSEKYEHELHLSSSQPAVAMDLPNEISMQTSDLDYITEIADRISYGKISERDEKYHNRLYYRRLISELIGLSINKIVGPLFSTAHYLPSDRTVLMHTHKLVVSALIQSASTAGINPTETTSLLSGILADFLEKLIRNEPNQRTRRKSDRLSSDIEKSILGGNIKFRGEPYSYHPSLVFRPNGWKKDLDLLNSSSMVTELAPLVLYLRYIVVEGDLLIVEEPESHLHPAMQVELMRQLTKVVNSGIKVIITTHSEWMLEKLANIVNFNKIPKSARSTTTDDSDYYLDSNMVGAWLFSQKKQPNGSLVTEIQLNESGLYPTGFDEVASELHNEYVSIAEKIESAR